VAEAPPELPPETGPAAAAEVPPPEAAKHIEKVENNDVSWYTSNEKESKFPLLWLLGGIVAAVGGFVLFLAGKAGKKPGPGQGDKKK
jgi:hypothetical protein